VVFLLIDFGFDVNNPHRQVFQALVGIFDNPKTSDYFLFFVFRNLKEFARSFNEHKHSLPPLEQKFRLVKILSFQ